MKVLVPLAKKSVLHKRTNKNQFKQNALFKYKNSTCKDLILAYYKLFIAENVIVSFGRLIEIAKFESLLRISVSKLENILEGTIHKAMAQSCQIKFQPN